MIKEGRIRTEKEDIEEFFSDLEDLEIAFEASGNYEYFYDLLEGVFSIDNILRDRRRVEISNGREGFLLCRTGAEGASVRRGELLWENNKRGL